MDSYSLVLCHSNQIAPKCQGNWGDAAPIYRSTYPVFFLLLHHVAIHRAVASSGEVEVCVGTRQIKLGSGSFFGEMALMNGQPRSADVTALDYSRFLTLSRRDFREILRYPSVRSQIAGTAGQRKEMNLQQPAEPANPSGTAAPPFA